MRILRASEASRNPHITLMKASVLIRLYLTIAAFTSCLEEDMLTLVWDLFQEVMGNEFVSQFGLMALGLDIDLFRFRSDREERANRVAS